MPNFTKKIGDRAITKLLASSEGHSSLRNKSYLVLSTPRVGSNLLCRALENSCLLGQPGEWFNIRIVQEIQARLNRKKFNLKGYVNTIIGKSKTKNGVFGVKVHIDQYKYWSKRGFDILKLDFDKIYYVERKDKIAQAYSFAKAMLTDSWTKEEENKSLKESPNIRPADVALRLAQICEFVDFFEQKMKVQIDRKFEFSNLVRDQAKGATHKILNDLELPTSSDTITSSDLEKQSDVKQLEEIARIKSYFVGQEKF